MRNFEAHTDVIRRKMLDDMGVLSVDSLFENIPKECRIKDFKMPDAISEMEAQKNLYKLSLKNKVDYINFLGGGAVKKYIPSCVNDVASRFEFLSAYTPYQPEISQGTLQVMYEFQSLICNLTNMDVSNASVYDGATACAEACLMAVRINKIKKVFISDKLNPNYIEVIKTYLWGQDIEFVISSTMPDMEFAGAIYSYPDCTGEISNLPAKKGKEILIACVDLSVLPVIEPPSADIIVGDFQPFGLPLNFGGPYGGFIAVKDQYKRQLTGRITGKTIDKNGKIAYVLTMQAREQHIRRSKATGNICSNQALCALCCALYLSVTGKKSLIEMAEISGYRARTLSKELDKIGYKTINKDFLNTFTIKMKQGIDSDSFLELLKKNGILGGIKLDCDSVAITLSEYIDKEDIEKYIEVLKNN